MRFKVELAADVVWFLRHATDREVDAFYHALQAARDDPTGETEPLADPRKSRYMLRFFRFGLNGIAVCEVNLARERIRMIECRRLPPKRRGKTPPDETAGA